jgi:hypothetical protein
MAYQRDASKVLPFLVEVESGQLITKKACKIQIPMRFADCGLAQVGIDTYIYGIYALIMDDGFYAVSNVCTMVKVEPSKTLTVKIDDVQYYEFYFNANDVVIADVNAMKRDLLIFNLMDEFINKGKVPWYYEYNDQGKIFDTSMSHAGSPVNDNLESVELVVSMTARNPEDLTQYYRTVVTDEKFLKEHPPERIPLKSVFYAATNTLNKLAGSYFNDGVVSALVNPTEHVERVEKLLRA